MKLFLKRYSHEKKQTLGLLYLLKDNNSIIDKWDSLELPWVNNERRVSCIPEGSYKVIKHKSPKFGNTLWLQDVPNRSEILIHKGNFYSDILGCILIGTDLKDINNDDFLDVVNSTTAVNQLMDYLKNISSISIKILN
jgi:hypothetical protein